jgi:hypothetical protein
MEDEPNKRRERIRNDSDLGAMRKLFGWLPFRRREVENDVTDVETSTIPVEVLESGTPLFFDDLPPIPAVTILSPQVIVECPSGSNTAPLVADVGTLRSEYNFSVLLLNRFEYINVLGADSEALEAFAKGELTPEEMSTLFGLPIGKATQAVEAVNSLLLELSDAVRSNLQSLLSCWYPSDEVTVSCPTGTVGNSVTLPAGARVSPISKAEANSLALAEASRKLFCEYVNNRIDVVCPSVADPVWAPLVSVTGGGTIAAGTIRAQSPTELQEKIALEVERVRNRCRYRATIIESFTSVSKYCLQSSVDEPFNYLRFDVVGECKTSPFNVNTTYKHYKPECKEESRFTESPRVEISTTPEGILDLLSQESGGEIVPYGDYFAYRKEEVVVDDSQMNCFMCNQPAVSYCAPEFSVACSPVPVAVVEVCEFIQNVSCYDAAIQEQLDLEAQTEAAARVNCQYGNNRVEYSICPEGQSLVSLGVTPGCSICGSDLGAVQTAAQNQAQAAVICTSEPGGGGGGGVSGFLCSPFQLIPISESTVQVCPGRVQYTSTCTSIGVGIEPYFLAEGSFPLGLAGSEDNRAVQLTTFTANSLRDVKIFGRYDELVAGNVASLPESGAYLYFYLSYEIVVQEKPECQKLNTASPPVLIISDDANYPFSDPLSLVPSDDKFCYRQIVVPVATARKGIIGPEINQILSGAYVINDRFVDIASGSSGTAPPAPVQCKRFFKPNYESDLPPIQDGYTLRPDFPILPDPP